MLRTPGLLSLLVLSTACTPTQWVRSDVTAAQADRDEVDCQRQAAREASLRAGGFYGPSYGTLSRWQGPAAMDRDGYRMLDEAGLTDFCMRAKGYQRAPRS